MRDLRIRRIKITRARFPAKIPRFAANFRTRVKRSDFPAAACLDFAEAAKRWKDARRRESNDWKEHSLFDDPEFENKDRLLG
jgi:hypothetical protein